MGDGDSDDMKTSFFEGIVRLVVVQLADDEQSLAQLVTYRQIVM